MKRRSVFRYCEIPGPVRRFIVAKFEPLASMVPPWCDHVNVWFVESGESENGDSNVECSPHYDYRWASIRVYPPWLAEPPDVQTDNLIHELYHVILSPLADWARDTLMKLVPKGEAEKFNAFLKEEVQQRVESVVQDLTYERMRAMPGKSPGPSVKNPKAYEALKKKGLSKEKAAKFSNAQAKSGKSKRK